MDKLIVGHIVNTFGIKGELKVEIVTDFASERFKFGNKFYVDNLCLKLKSVRYHKGFALLAFSDYEDINLVEQFKGKDLLISKDDIKPLDDGYYFYQLVDLDVYDNDNLIGKVTDIESYPANNVLRVKTKDKDVLIPYVPAFIKNVDLENKQISINVIEGLL